MSKIIILAIYLAAPSLWLNAHAQDEHQYPEGPVAEVDYLNADCEHLEEYVDWLTSSWKQYLWMTYKNAAEDLALLGSPTTDIDDRPGKRPRRFLRKIVSCLNSTVFVQSDEHARMAGCTVGL